MFGGLGFIFFEVWGKGVGFRVGFVRGLNETGEETNGY